MDKQLVVTHKLFNGVGQDLFKYFRKQEVPSVLMEHEFSSLKTRRTIVTVFNGEKEKQSVSNDYSALPEIVCYLKDIIFTLMLLFSSNRYDFAFGCGGFNAFACLILKLFGKTNTVVFYTIDYVPERFMNPFLNRIYHLIDKICVKYCDETWNLSPMMSDAREKYNKMPIRIYHRQKVVPVGVWLDELPQKQKKAKYKKQLLFVGHLLEKQGVQLVLNAIPHVINELPDFKFVIIGDGDFRLSLEKIVRELKISKYVEFHGAIFNNDVINKFLGESHLSIAMYDRKLDKFTRYADPTKLKTYLAMRVPIILTDVPYNAKDIEKAGCGKIVDFDVDQMKNAIISMMKDKKKLDRLSTNAWQYIQQFDWNTIFRRVLPSNLTIKR